MKLVEGYSRTDKTVGSQYDLYFETDTKNIFKEDGELWALLKFQKSPLTVFLAYNTS